MLPPAELIPEGRELGLSVISAFPNDGAPWRIDWFGDVSFPNRLVRRKQPSILVYLSRVIDPNFRENPAVLLSAASTFASKQRKVWVSVGTLSLLSVGDVWCDGQLALRPDYEVEHFSELDANPQSATLIKAGLNLEDRGFLLPRAEHPWHMQCTQSYCLMVELSLGRRLIVPCIELIRFYFGSSSSLLTKLFLPPLGRETLYSKADLNRSSGHLALELAATISGRSAADIGRLAVDPVAWRAACHVGASLLKGSVSGHEAYAQAFFPFEGKTNLTAAGKWLPFEDSPKATFIVYTLRSCSHQFPFRSLRYDVKDRKPAPTSQLAAAAGNAARSFQRSAARNAPKQQHLAEKDPSNRLARNANSFGRQVRYSDLENKSVWKDKSLASPEEQISRLAVSSPLVDQGAPGDPGAEHRVRPVDFEMLAYSSRANSVPEFLRATVEQLKKLSGFTINLLTESDHDGWTIPIIPIADEEGEIPHMLFIGEGEQHWRLRRVAVFSVRRDHAASTIVAVEAEPIQIRIYGPHLGMPDEVSQTIRRAASDYVARRGFDVQIVGLTPDKFCGS